MGRPQRTQFDGLLLHITIRCNNREFYFHQPEDYQTLLDLMQEMVEAHRICAYDYTLMSNHSHWLLSQRGATPLSTSLRWVFGEYARWYNRTYQRRGHFWEDRYRTTIIEQDDHALICMRYIARNPVRAMIVSNPSDYPWSGYKHYAGLKIDPLLKLHPVYLALGRYPKEREKRYRDFVENKIQAEQDKRSQRISGAFAFGSKAFRTHLKRRFLKDESAHSVNQGVTL